MNDILKYFLLILCAFCLNSCDILRFSKFEVISWAPGEGYHSETEKISVSLSFSRDPDVSSVERGFSLSGNGNKISGKFLWNGRTMTFRPLAPLEKNTDYSIYLSIDACDTKGLSLDDAFSREFTTRADNTRPILLSCYPEPFSQLGDPRTEVMLLFSVPVPLSSLYGGVSFNPSMPGSWRLENEGCLAVFTPSEPWQTITRYEIRVSSSLADNNGMGLGNEYFSVFSTDADNEAPYLLNAYRITKDSHYIELLQDAGFFWAAYTPVENTGWEKDDKLCLVFSEPVDGVSLRNYISADNAPGLVLESSSSNSINGFDSEFIFSFSGIPSYNSRFTVAIKPGIKDMAGNESRDDYLYRFLADGKFSKPPELKGIRMPMSPGGALENAQENEEDLNLAVFDTDSVYPAIAINDAGYPSGEKIETWIELYFDVCEGASVDLFSLMDLFRIETSNNVISFSPSRIISSSFSVNECESGWEEYKRIEIRGSLTNTTNYGIIYFIVGAGLKDSLGNKSEKTLMFPAVK